MRKDSKDNNLKGAKDPAADEPTSAALNRRNMLLAGMTLAAVSTPGRNK
jgi:hypothetical protein